MKVGCACLLSHCLVGCACFFFSMLGWLRKPLLFLDEGGLRLPLLFLDEGGLRLPLLFLDEKKQKSRSFGVGG